jgi:hypothetical protein
MIKGQSCYARVPFPYLYPEKAGPRKPDFLAYWSRYPSMAWTVGLPMKPLRPIVMLIRSMSLATSTAGSNAAPAAAAR